MIKSGCCVCLVALCCSDVNIRVGVGVLAVSKGLTMASGADGAEGVVKVATVGCGVVCGCVRCVFCVAR